MALATQRSRRTREKPVVQSRVRDEARALYRKAILDAAEAVFAERGVANARVQDIAARARLAVGTIYNHFEQKEDILIALLTERAHGFLELFRQLDSDGATFEEQLIARFTRLFAYVHSHRTFFQLASDHGLFGGPTASAEKLLGGKKLSHAGDFERAIVGLVDQGLAEGALAPTPPGLLALHLRHTVRTGAVWIKQGGEGDVAAIARTVVDLFLNGAGSAGRGVPARAGGKKLRK
ncbi:MAG: TetR family transcriptional regulator [Labilithrix sp.]|nr:TetR family transcriptional regulator [Labilithrix sp.]